MKRNVCYGGLLVICLLYLASCGSLSLSAKHHTPPLEQPQNKSAILPPVQVLSTTKPNPFIRLLRESKRKIYALFGLLWLWLLTRFYGNEKRRRIPGWSLDDLGLLKGIKDNVARLWRNHHPRKNIINLEDWKKETEIQTII